MTARQATFNILKGYTKGYRFTGYGLMLEVKRRTGQVIYPDTALRYLRILREDPEHQIINVDKRKSIYQVM